MEVEKCENIEDQPRLAVNVLTDLKHALENGKAKGEGLLETGTIEDVVGLSEQLMTYIEKLEKNGGPFLEPRKIDPLKNQAYKLEQKLWPAIERLMGPMEMDGHDDDHDDHDDHDKHRPGNGHGHGKGKDEDNEIDDMKTAGIDKESIAKE